MKTHYTVVRCTCIYNFIFENNANKNRNALVRSIFHQDKLSFMMVFSTYELRHIGTSMVNLCACVVL